LITGWLPRLGSCTHHTWWLVYLWLVALQLLPRLVDWFGCGWPVGWLQVTVTTRLRGPTPPGSRAPQRFARTYVGGYSTVGYHIVQLVLCPTVVRLPTLHTPAAHRVPTLVHWTTHGPWLRLRFAVGPVGWFTVGWLRLRHSSRLRYTQFTRTPHLVGYFGWTGSQLHTQLPALLLLYYSSCWLVG
jgi:hypothetical protein